MDICIYGASRANLEKIYYDGAEALGLEIARRGWGLVFGGGANGLMGACARGVSAGGGRILGIAPRFFDEPGILYDKCTDFVFTETMRERKQAMEDRSDAVVVLPGGIGTYEEFFEMLTLRQLGRSQMPMAILNINDYYAPMAALLESTVRQKFMSSRPLELFAAFKTPAEALDYIADYVPPENVPRLEDYDKE